MAFQNYFLTRQLRLPAPQMAKDRRLNVYRSFFILYSIKEKCSPNSLLIRIPSFSFTDRTPLNFSRRASFNYISVLNYNHLNQTQSVQTTSFSLSGFIVRNNIFMQEDHTEPKDNKSYFDGAFNLHPQDALAFSQTVSSHLQAFTEGFKERIEIQIDYSKSLFKVSKRLQKHVHADKPSPMSYLSSAFQVQHQQRARHALQLAEYLHSQIQIPCQKLLHETQLMMKQFERDVRGYYKEGQNVEQNYQKQLKKYFRTKQDWEQRLMNAILLSHIPGTSQGQLEKARSKVQSEKADIINLQNKYLNSLKSFNTFAEKYNERISEPLRSLEDQCLKQLTVESDSIRKLIVSEINMFKNIEYDLLNISRQMEALKPSEQIAVFNEQAANRFRSPIISIYSQGPITERGTQIDLKYPISSTFLEETLVKIDNGYENWMLDNKHNSTLRYCLQQAWRQFTGMQSEQFIIELEECIVNNKVVQHVPFNNNSEFINQQQVFSVAFSIICTLGSFVRDIPLSQQKQGQTIQLLRKQVSVHTYYRFIAVVALEQLVSLRQNQLQKQTQAKRLILVLKLLLDQSFASKDTFVIRIVLSIIFTIDHDPPLWAYKTIKQEDQWNSTDLWEAIFFQANFQEISLIPAMTKSQLRQIYLMRQKNIMFSSMTTTSHQMAIMGCQQSQIQTVILRFSFAFGLYDQHRRDLIKVARSSVAEYQRVMDKLDKSLNARQSWEAKDQKEETRQDPTDDMESLPFPNPQ